MVLCGISPGRAQLSPPRPPMRSHSLRETPEFWFWFELTNRSIETHLKESDEEMNKHSRLQIPGFEGQNFLR
jgi:hypothetical protein